MVQNRSKLITLFIGNISNSIIHKILEEATVQEELYDKYNKELLTSLEIAKRYRRKINPVNKNFSKKDREDIRNRIIKKVNSELQLRISKGYLNINLNLIEKVTDKFLKDAMI